MKEEKPWWEHDCENCKFMGNFIYTTDGSPEENDLYFCPRGSESSFIRRFGDEGGDYESMSFETFGILTKSSRTAPPFWTAKIFIGAVSAGYIDLTCKDTRVRSYSDRVYQIYLDGGKIKAIKYVIANMKKETGMNFLKDAKEWVEFIIDKRENIK
jgi:hypothetical protein